MLYYNIEEKSLKCTARLVRVFLWAKTMDENELDLYLDAIDMMDPLINPVGIIDSEFMLHEQVRDERGFRVEGCYRTQPAPTE